MTKLFASKIFDKQQQSATSIDVLPSDLSTTKDIQHLLIHINSQMMIKEQARTTHSSSVIRYQRPLVSRQLVHIKVTLQPSIASRFILTLTAWHADQYQQTKFHYAEFTHDSHEFQIISNHCEWFGKLHKQSATSPFASL